MVAAALAVAGCGSSIGGQASPAVTTPPTSTLSSTSISVAPFPEPSTGAVPSTPTTGSRSGTTASSGTGPTTAPSTTAPSTTVKWLLPLPKGGTPKVNKYGNVIAAPGQSFAIQWQGNKQIAVVFIVDSLQVDRGCQAQGKPRNGHLLVITVRAQLGYSTGKDLSDESIGFTKDAWTAFDAKDTAQVGIDSPAADDCVTFENQMPYADDMEPDQVYRGKIALDVSSATGTAVLMNSLDGGWVYHYG